MRSRVGIRSWTAAVVLVGLVGILLTYRDYGITWDEPLQARYGEAVLEYFSSGFDSPVEIEPAGVRHYGPVFELAAALAYAGEAAEKYPIRHLLIACVGLLGVVGTIRIASLVGTPWMAVFAPLILITLPRFYGHSFANSKDIPFAVGFTWAVYGICRFATGPRRWLYTFGCGIALGAALATRPGGMPLLLLLFVGTLALAALAGGGWRQLALRGAAAWALGWVVMVAFWPWAHEDPVWNPLEAVSFAFAGPKTFPVLFEGRVVMSDQLPRTYMTKYLLITTPPVVLGLGLLGLVWAAKRQLQQPRSRDSLLLFAIETWMFAPLLLTLVFRPNVYDGMRHLLFTLPALALLAGLGAAALVEWARPGWPRRAAAGLLVAACALPLPSLVRLHPYQMTYFNAFVGGVAGASGRYETDYWLSSYKEAVEWINHRASQRAGQRLRILVAIDGYARDCAAAFLKPGVEASTTTSAPRAMEPIAATPIHRSSIGSGATARSSR
jgi:hypothetical protein